MMTMMTMTTMTNPIPTLFIEMPREEDMDFSDAVWWEKFDTRQELIEGEDLDNIPDSEWEDVIYEIDEDDEE